MKKVIFPLMDGMQGTAVADLQAALLVLLDRNVLDISDAEREEIGGGLKLEHASQVYKGATVRMVELVQERRGVQPENFGQVDQATADVINEILQELGLLGEEPGGWTQVVEALSVQGETLSAINAGTNFLSSIDAKIGALGQPPTVALNMRGAAVAELHELLGKIGVVLPRGESAETLYGSGTRDAILQLQAKYNLASTGLYDDATRNALAIAVGTVANPSRVEGRIFTENGLPAANVKLQIVNRGFGDDAPVLGEIATDERGFYALPYDSNGSAANIEIHALAENGEMIQLSNPKVNADRTAIINLIAPAAVQTQTNEWQLMATDLATLASVKMSNLAQAREDEQGQDVSLLHQRTQWDARLIATAATAAKATETTGIEQVALYGALRAGLPSEKEALAQVSDDAFVTALTRANAAGVVALNDEQIRKAQSAFAQFKFDARREMVVPGALSSVGEMLANAPIDTVHLETFAKLAILHEGDDAALWSQAAEQGVPADQISTLQLQGKLAYLTLNNAPLTAQLQNEIGIQDNLAQMVEQDLYRADQWETRLNTLAGDNPEKLAQLIPSVYAQPDVNDRRAAYADDMARKVRQSYPTHVVRRMIGNEELKLGDKHAELQAPVQTFLQNAVAEGFEIGRTPVEQFMRDHKATVLAGLDENDQRLAQEGAQLLTRAYQMTPSDNAMTTLLDLGFTSARQVSALDRVAFVERYWERFGSRTETEVVWDKSQQISSTTFNIYTLAKKVDSDPPLMAISGSLQKHNDDKEKLKGLLKQYPTMESLFGSQDFCECEHCRSVLSPAAYLVDLLRFIDRSEQDWQIELAHWKQTHNGKTYADYNYRKPYDVFFERRPDIPHLPLTCENTNVALPYIDLVNEILEYYVAHKGLDAKAVHDTGEATSAELLAEPHNLIPAAYDILKEATYPLNLPFDLWLETVRRFCDYFETPLWQVLDVFRPNDTLFPPAAGYTRAAIFSDYLGISAAEYALYIAATPDLPKLYGYKDDVATVMTTLQSAKTLARRLGVSYKELTALMQTEFINPHLSALVILQKLRVDIHDVLRYKKLPNNALLSDEQKLDKAEFEKRLVLTTEKYKPTSPTFDAEQRLKTVWDEPQFKRILFLRDDDAGCDFEKTMLFYSDDSAATAFDFVKLNLFVRLWKRLGWTLEETDHALKICLVTPIADLTDATFGQTMRTALVYLAHLRELSGLLNVGKNGRLKLLTLWSALPPSLYAQLFLTRSVLKEDAVFDDPLGDYLSDPNVLLVDHLPALQAALTLTTAEIELILQDNGLAISNVPLTLANVSLLYRYGLLAKGLRLSIAELITLKALSGLNPFHPLHQTPLDDIADDHPFHQTLAFVRQAQQVKGSGFIIGELDYLLRHRVDPLDKRQEDGAVTLDWIGRLAAQLNGISADFAIPTLAENLTAEALQQKIALVYAPFAPIFEDAVRAISAEERLAHLQQILPFLQDKVTRQTIVQAATTQFGADAALIETLLSTTIAPFASLNQRGLSIERTPNNADAPAIVSDVVVKAEDNLTAASWRGYITVPQDGDYRFFAKLGKQAAIVRVSFDMLPTPVLDETAAQDEAEWERSVTLKAGVLHPITVVVSNLQSGLFALLIQGETTAKGQLSQFVTLPQTTVATALTAYTLLGKKLQLVTGVGLSAREVGYLLGHSAEFILDLNQLPTQELPAAGGTQFAGLLRLLDYAALKREMAGGGDDLIALFERTPFDTVEDLAGQVATLTRRTADGVLAVSAELHLTTPSDFRDIAKLSRLWQALQIVERFGLPMAALKTWLTPTPDATVVAVVRNTIKARFELETWQRIAKAIFDPLRQKQRDALVAHIMHIKPELTSLEKLFEYFLIDPGMEPVVQTSRLRLAISSVQTFIQRCFLNLEPQVHPSVLNARHWNWMKRYRIWEANRKIFLFPENWLEPEWRDDKTHLYQELESSLLQGDVTNQLAEDALYVYLKKLDQLARLEIVTMYAEESGFGPPTMHVIGRTYALPHQYFYRRYAHQMWTAWEPVNTEIDGQHIVAVMWRERLHLFWLTFLEKVEQSSSTPVTNQPGGLGTLSFDTLLGAAATASRGATTRKVDIQLNWSEYLQGSWTVKESSGFGNTVSLSAPFDPTVIFVTVAPEFDSDTGENKAVRIHLNGLSDFAVVGRGRFGYQFRVVSKNSRPSAGIDQVTTTLQSPYQTDETEYNHHMGYEKLSVLFVQQVVTTDGNVQRADPAPQPILGNSTPFTLLPTSNQMTLPNAEFAPLISPLFYADDRHTFFVEPSLIETTVDKWQGYTITRPSQKSKWQDYLETETVLKPRIPSKYLQDAIGVADIIPQPDPIDGLARHALLSNLDSYTQSGNVVQFGDVLIGATGAVRDNAAIQSISRIAFNK